MINVGVLHHRQLPRGSTSPRPTWRRCTASPRSGTRSCASKLTPDYDFGCKRPTFSNGYYRSFTKPHVHLQAGGIDHIEADGIVDNDGTKTVIDTLVLATGFDLWEANFPAIEVDRPRGPQPRKVVARHQIPGLSGCLDAVLPELPEPGQSVCVPRVELLQHDGIPDAAHGPAVRRAQAPRCHDVRGHRGSQHPLPRPDDRAARRFGVRTIGNCATSRSYYFNPSGEAHAAAADVDARRPSRKPPTSR